MPPSQFHFGHFVQEKLHLYELLIFSHKKKKKKKTITNWIFASTPVHPTRQPGPHQLQQHCMQQPMHLGDRTPYLLNYSPVDRVFQNSLNAISDPAKFITKLSLYPLSREFSLIQFFSIKNGIIHFFFNLQNFIFK